VYESTHHKPTAKPTGVDSLESAGVRAASGAPASHAEYMRSYLKRPGPRAKHLARVAKNRRAATLASRSVVHAHLAAHPCVDCGESDVVVLEFDHVRGVKSAHVSDVVRRGWSLDRLRDEIAKCEVRCANCHRRATHRRREAAA
jgi:hypothetical protein